MVDSITDFLNRIRNTQAVSRPTVSVPFSKLKYEIAKTLKRQELIEKVEKKGRRAKKILEITLKYDNGLRLKRISRPGQRIYKRAKEIKPVKGGRGVAIISTPKGLMTDKEARKKKLGGEILCEVW